MMVSSIVFRFELVYAVSSLMFDIVEAASSSVWVWLISDGPALSSLVKWWRRIVLTGGAGAALAWPRGGFFLVVGDVRK